MRSSNPVFSRRGFSRGDGGYAGFGGGGQQPQGGNPYAGTNPYNNGTPETLQEMYQAPPAGPLQTGRMTIDDVVMRTAMTLGTVAVGALVGWVALAGNLAVAFGAMFIAFVLGMIQALKREPVPALILAYAAFEGIFLGVLSEAYNQQWSGAPLQAVLVTMAISGGMLVAYRTRLIRVTSRYQRIGMAIAIGFVLLLVVNLLLSVFGVDLGLRSGPLGIIVAVVGILLGAFFLSLDFKQIEDGITYGAPQREAWLAAFGLTLSLVWIYLEMLRLISILRD